MAFHGDQKEPGQDDDTAQARFIELADQRVSPIRRFCAGIAELRVHQTRCNAVGGSTR